LRVQRRAEVRWAELRQEADALVEAHASCEKNEDCTFGPIISCLYPCGSAVNTDSNVAELTLEGKPISDDFAEQGCACPSVDCAIPSELRFVCVDHQCQSELR
jgi:hypothetical protein